MQLHFICRENKNIVGGSSAGLVPLGVSLTQQLESDYYSGRDPRVVRSCPIAAPRQLNCAAAYQSSNVRPTLQTRLSEGFSIAETLPLPNTLA